MGVNRRVSVDFRALQIFADKMSLNAADIQTKAGRLVPPQKISLRTVQRIFDGDRCYINSLDTVCAALGADSSTFLIEDPQNKMTSFDKFVGNWVGFTLETDLFNALHVVEDKIKILVVNNNITIANISSDAIRNSDMDSVALEVIGEMLAYRTGVVGWTPPDGCGYVQLVLKEGGLLLDGYSMYIDSNNKCVFSTRLLYYRDNESGGRLRGDIIRLIEKELSAKQA